MKSLAAALYIALFCALVAPYGLRAQNVQYLPLYTSGTFTKTIDTNKPVGFTPGAGSVSPGGGAVYTIPVAVPPGTNGVAPQLSLVYNSQGGDGVLGMGWSIAGISAVARVPRSQYFDDKTEAVEMTYDDRFALDGTRLMLVSGTYGYNGATYATEAESFATITSYGTTGNGPDRFEVWTKDGTIMEYGNTSDSKYYAGSGLYGGSSVLYWKLNKIRYPDGNYIEFKYIQTFDDWQLDEINYTGNTSTGLLPYNKIKFNYLVRSDINTRYEAGRRMQNYYLLDKITVTAEGNTLVKEYRFGYGFDNMHSFLRELTEAGADGATLNSTIFKYGDIPNAFESSVSSVTEGQSVDLFSGDFNGDGISDMMAASYTYASGNNSNPYHTQFKIYKGYAAGFFTYEMTQALTPNYNVIKNNSTLGRSLFYIADFNGDGSDDVVTTRVTFGTTYHTLNNVHIYTSNGLGTAFTLTTKAPYTGYPRLHTSGNWLYPGDFNGDGIQDLLLLAGNTANTYQAFIYLGGSSGGFVNVGQTGTYTINESSWAGAGVVQTTDFNGDGRTDLLVSVGTTTEIFQLEGYSFERIFNGGLPNTNYRLFPADFNGDGKTDFLAQEKSTNLWTKYMSTGTAFDAYGFSFYNPVTYSGQPFFDDVLMLADYNGDGRTDILHGWNYNQTSSKLDMYYSKGNTFHFVQHSYASPVLNGSRWNTAFDSNGDGRAELANRLYYYNPIEIFHFNKEGKDLILQKVKNGIDHTTEWTYKRMTEDNSFYNRGSLSTTPIRNFQLPLNMVYEQKEDNGSGGTTTSRYAYEEAKLHRLGKGLLGFKKITSDNLAMGVKSVQETDFNTTYNAPWPYRSSLYLSSNNSLIRQTTLTNTFVSMGAKRYFLRTDASTDNQALEGRTVSSTFTYDSYGNVTQQTTNNAGIETTTTTTVYGTAATPVPAKPTSVTISNTRSGQTAYANTTTFTYNTTTGQLTGKTEFSGKPKSVTTAYTYNSLGNATGTTVTPTGMSARSASSTYDAKGRYPLTMTNALGQSSTYTYDARWGKPLTVTGVDGLSTSFQYDAWGRLTTTTTPDVTLTESYVWDVNAGESTIFYHQIQNPADADVKTWYDLLGRNKKRQTEGFLGQWSTEVWTYDSRGNVATATQPYKPGETYLTNTHTYDAYNRLSTAVNTLGTTTYAYSYSSGNLTTTATNPASQVSSKVTDASGKLISATDYGGTLSYTYNSQGNLTQVQHGTTTVATNAYDEQGRQTQLIDPNAGTTAYVYDALGQLVSQTNAHNQTTTMTYDLAGRLTQRSGPEGNTTYEYFPTGSGASTNQLKKITGFGGTLEEYTYTAKGHLSTKKETVDGTAHTLTYSRDAYGRISSVTYPSGLVISYTYDSYGSGQLYQLKRGTTVLFTNTAMNGLGQYTSYSLGNGKTTQVTYSYGMPTRYYAAGVQDLNLSWNFQSGNLNSRYDAVKGKTESFTYDNLNRLTGSTVAGQSALTQTYAANGNISTKHDAGAYSYDAARLHAVNNVTNPNTTIPLVTQNITYTPYYQPATIAENNYSLTLSYAADYERIKTVLKQGTTTLTTRYFFDGYEKTVTGSTTQYIQYISAGDGLALIYVSQGTTHTPYYAYTDHLGSILTLTNSSGTVVAEQNYDAWGRRRNPATWTYSSVPAVPAWLYRGYTGHEELPQFGLINMNGRLYDPLVGRMLSPDNNVQAPGYTQNFNRYSYALNNPLRFTDPDGEFVFSLLLPGIGTIIDAALWGAVIGGATAVAINGTVNVAKGEYFFKNAGRSFGIGAIGGAIGGVFSGIGIVAKIGQEIGYGIMSNVSASIVTDMALGNEITAGTLIGGVAGGIISSKLPDFKGFDYGSKYDIGDVIKNSFTELGYNALKGGLTGALSGGIGAAVNGDNIGKGIARSLKAGTIAGAIKTGLTQMIGGPVVRPNKGIEFALRVMELDLKIRILDGPGTPVFRTGGLWQRGLTTPKSIIIGRSNINNVNTWVHEGYHFYQQLSGQTWAGQVGKGVVEQFIVNPFLMLKGSSVYYQSKYNEGAALDYERLFSSGWVFWRNFIRLPY